MKRILVIVLSVVVSMALAAAAFGYEVVDVKNGGTIKGKIKAASKPDDPVLKIDKDVEFCGKSLPAHMYIISPAMEVKNALVFVEDVAKGKAAPKSDITVDNNKCAFLPVVGVAFKGGNFVVKNSDNILHNTNLGILMQDKRSTVYNLALPRKDQVITKPIRRVGLHQIKCDAHSWMRAFLYVSEHPYAAVTDASGSFEIKDLPPGKYKVKVWHEGFAEVVKDVEVAAGKAADLSVTLSKK